jgi:hypothetical protein
MNTPKIFFLLLVIFAVAMEFFGQDLAKWLSKKSKKRRRA